MEADLGQLIAAVQPESIADELGLSPGDRLLAIDDQPVRDVFDYRTRTATEELVLTVRKADGEMLLFEIEKDEDEDLGLDFANPMLDDCHNCHNRCVFCFIDQLPEGMRPSLYLKDDDLRLSFLTGNYVTLTNVTPAELERIIEYRFSPLNISVHATDPQVRRRLMRNRHAGELMPALQRIAAAGIRINAQIVLVPGFNDGEVLRQTLTDLASLAPALLSIAIVPVGITRYRVQRGLVSLRAVTPEEANAVLDLTAEWQARFQEAGCGRVLFAADEFYLKAGAAFPPAETYEDFPQLENGVGMIPLFRQELAAGLARLRRRRRTSAADKTAAAAAAKTSDASSGADSLPARVILVTGTAAGPLLTETAALASAALGLTVESLPVVNRFFGETITVAGLLTGQDILAALRERLAGAPAVAGSHSGHADTDGAIAPAAGDTAVLIPECMLRAGTQVFLDDLTVEDLASQSGCLVQPVRPEAADLLQALAGLAGRPDLARAFGSRRAPALSTAERPDSMSAGR